MAPNIDQRGAIGKIVAPLPKSSYGKYLMTMLNESGAPD